MASQRAKKRLRALNALSDEHAPADSGSDTFYITQADALRGAPVSLVPAAGASQDVHNDAVSADQRRILRDSIPVQVATGTQPPQNEASEPTSTSAPLEGPSDSDMPYFFEALELNDDDTSQTTPLSDEHARRYTNSVS